MTRTYLIGMHHKYIIIAMKNAAYDGHPERIWITIKDYLMTFDAILIDGQELIFRTDEGFAQFSLTFGNLLSELTCYEDPAVL